jgi:hypothetical protein
MNDLLHPIQQRERMEAFASVEEKNTYAAYSRLWTGGRATALLTIKAPATAKRVDEETYLVLLQKRVSWMMQRWLRDLQGSQAELEHQLNRAIAQLQPISTSELMGTAAEEDCPSLQQWCSGWAETLVQECDRITEILQLENIQFPIFTLDQSEPHFQEWCDLHDETDIETWLAFLIAA